MFRSMVGASKEQRLAARYVPKGARKVTLHGDASGSALYLYEVGGKFYAIGFRGTSSKSEFHYAYRTEQARAERAREFFASLKHSAEFKATQRSAKAAWVNPLKVGDLLYTSWGYDQTNVEFFAVTRVSGRRVWVREIAQDSEGTGFMSGKCWPAMPIRYVGEETMHTAQPSGAQGVYLKIDNSRHAWPEQGGSHGWSSYA